MHANSTAEQISKFSISKQDSITNFTISLLTNKHRQIKITVLVFNYKFNNKFNNKTSGSYVSHKHSVNDITTPNLLITKRLSITESYTAMSQKTKTQTEIVPAGSTQSMKLL